MSLACVSCRGPLTPAEIVKGALSSVAQECLVDFRCAGCGERGLARLSDGLVEIGRSEGAGFKAISFEVASDLAVAPRRRALTIWYRGAQRRVPERRGNLVGTRAPLRSPDR